MKALKTLLATSIDYAGLFPPATLAMEQAVHNYAQYRRSPERWMLSRYIVPLARRAEFERAYVSLDTDESGWPLSILGPATAATFDELEAWNESALHEIDTLETKATTVEEIAQIAQYNAKRCSVFVEIPVHADPRPLIAAIAEHGLYAKIRTGGSTPDLFPTTYEVLRFLEACVEYNLPFKATAGLHHPLRNNYRLTYEPDSAHGMMFGFMNMFLTTTAMAAGWELVTTKALLEASSPIQFNIDNAIVWQGLTFSPQDLQRGRELMISIGSCSFTEPVEELQAYQWLSEQKENQ